MIAPFRNVLYQLSLTSRVFKYLRFSTHCRLASRFSTAMSPKPIPSDMPVHAFPTSSDFDAFLSREHATAAGIYLKLAKKASGIASISAAEAVEVALCYGWIDGRANTIDNDYWTVRYTPRRAKSTWSQKNVATVARLIEEGRMRPAGLMAVQAAKEDGRWDRAYAGSSTIAVPDDFNAALARQPAGEEIWNSMKKSQRYSILSKSRVLWCRAIQVHAAMVSKISPLTVLPIQGKIATVSEKNRPNRIAAEVQILAQGQRPGAASRVAAARKEAKPYRSNGVNKATTKRIRRAK